MSVAKLKKNHLKIGIIGAGPAGALAAYLLSKKGHKVEILERKNVIERKVCGEYLCPKGVELLEELNLEALLTEGFLPLHGMVLASPDNDIIPTYFPTSTKKERGLSLNRALFDERLIKIAQDSGADLLLGKTVSSVYYLNNKWIVKTESEEFSYDFLIAADGRQSKIGHILGHTKKINTHRAALHCYLPRKTERGLRLGEMHILKNGSYCGLDPINDDSVNFSIVLDSSILKIKRPEEIINETIASSKRLGQMFDPITKDNDIRVVTTLKNNNNFIAGDALAYVGDAAGFIDPLTGEGIYNALLSATILCEALEKEHNLSDALSLYKKTKKSLSREKGLINHFFQFLIKHPILIRLTVKFLNKSPERANHFVGIIGNIHTPINGFIKMLKA